MAWITPVTSWIAGNGIGFSDLNRIEGNTDYIYSFGLRPDVLSITSSAISLLKPVTVTGALTVSADTDITCILGKSAIFGSSDSAYFSHFDRKSTTDYALRQPSDGNTLLNTKAGGTVFIRDGGSLDLATFSGTAISLLKPTTIAGALTIDNTAGITASSTINLLKPVTITGATTITGTTGTLLSVGAGSNISASIGRGKFGFASGGSSGHFYIAHRDFFTGSDFGLDLASDGATLLNCVAGKSVYIRNGGGDIASFSNSAISLLKPVTELNMSGNINPTTTPTSGTWDSSDSGAIPRGMYNVQFTASGGATRIYQNGSQLYSESSFGASFFSDGVNTTMLITGSSTIKYWKF